MKDLLVNILPISEKPRLREEMMHQFLSTIQAMASSTHWNQKKIRFTLAWGNNRFTFEGGRYHLPPHCIKFVSAPVDIFDTNILHSDWLKGYDQFVFLADAKEVAENHRTRLEIAKYRSLMHRQKLHTEEALLLLNVQNILTIPKGYSYENTMVSVLSALAGKPRKGFTLLPGYTFNWSQIINLHLGQRQFMLRTKNGNVIGMPINLTGTFDAFPHSGIMELLWKFMTIMLEDNNIEIKRISNHLIYNTTMAFFRNFTKIFTDSFTKTIRLAVIGETSSGKSYLLQDILTSFNDMEFTSENNIDDDRRYGGDYIADVLDRNNALGATVRSAARIDNHYRIKYENKSSKFCLEFIDIPGEVITRDKIAIFSSVINALKRNTDNETFQIETWEKNNQSYKILLYRTNDNEHSTKSQPSYSGGLEDDEKPKMNGKSATSSQSIMTNYEVREHLKNRGFTKNDALTQISGEDVIEDFYDFYPDTVVNAIVDAWTILNPTRPQRFQDDTINAENNFLNIFKEHCQLDFYYLFYCMTSTDIVICNKMAIPAKISNHHNNNSTDGLRSFNFMMNALKNLSDNEIFERKNWYMVLKGSDSYMNPSTFKNLFAALQNHNATYSYFITLLLHFIQLHNNQNVESNPFMEDVESENTSISQLFESSKLNDFRSILASENVNNRVLENMQKFAREHQSPSNMGQFFKPSNEYVITSNNDLKGHINKCIERFKELTNFEETDGLYDYLQIPPHVYFPATPITSDFTICGHQEGQANIFTGDASFPGNRICFGTFQLCLDILKQHEIVPDSENARYGGLLSYFMGE